MVSVSDTIALALGLTGLVFAAINIYVTRDRNVQTEPDHELALLDPTSSATAPEEGRDLSNLETLVPMLAERRTQVHQAISDALDALSRLVRVHG